MEEATPLRKALLLRAGRASLRRARAGTQIFPTLRARVGPLSQGILLVDDAVVAGPEGFAALFPV